MEPSEALHLGLSTTRPPIPRACHVGSATPRRIMHAAGTCRSHAPRHQSTPVDLGPPALLYRWPFVSRTSYDRHYCQACCRDVARPYTRYCRAPSGKKGRLSKHKVTEWFCHHIRQGLAQQKCLQVQEPGAKTLRQLTRCTTNDSDRGDGSEICIHETAWNGSSALSISRTSLAPP